MLQALSFPLTLGVTQAMLQRLGVPIQRINDRTPAAHTGTVSETTIKTWAMPGNAIGPNGYIEGFLNLGPHTNNVNTKTYRVKIGGTTVLAVAATATANGKFYFRVHNMGVTNAQNAGTPSAGVSAFSSTAAATAAIDTTAPFNITLTMQLGVAGDSMAIYSADIATVFRP